MMTSLALRGQRDRALEAKLTEALIGASFGRSVYAFQRVKSTMELAHALAAHGVPEGTLVFAAHQEEGRGRLGRTWASPTGGIYLSVILRPSRPATDIPQLSLVAGLAAAEAIRELAGLFPSIRWPNDVLLHEKKVGGILVEAKDGAVVVGVGMNVSARLTDLPETATTLAVCGADCDPYRLTGELCRRLESWYHVWSAKGFGPIRESLRPWIGLFGHPVHLTAGSTEFEGTATDLDEQGRLVVRLDSGIQKAFEMGEVTRLQ